MKNLYLIIKTKPTDSNIAALELLTKNASKKNISVTTIYTEEFDFSNPPTLTNDDGLYRISAGKESALIEKIIINDQTNTLYKDYRTSIGRLDSKEAGSSLIHQKHNLPIIPTIYSITNNKAKLKKYTNLLGGFPIIIKATGSSHGIGVMRIDSFESLISISDYLINQPNNYILRKYIPHDKQARIVIVGNNVISAHENISTSDFRTNINTGEKRIRQIVKFEPKINEIAIKAARALNYEFGGVDLLFHSETNEPYIAEVNFPCDFAASQELTGANIAGAMIDHLITKSINKI